MEREDLQTWGEQLRRELDEGRSARRSKKWRCPAELRSRIISYVEACRGRGEPYLDIAVRLGLVESTLTRWMRTEKVRDEPSFRPVSIVAADEEERRLPPGSQRALRLITPRGYVVEGLDMESAAYLLEVLR
jgi:hypothetical protein